MFAMIDEFIIINKNKWISLDSCFMPLTALI